MPELWTVGHGARPVDHLLAALRAHRIATLVDVRRFPASRRHPQFAQPALRGALERAGMAYVHLEDLGGLRDGGYEAHMATPAWQAAFDRLAALAAASRVAVCCAETSPDACHRRLIAAHALRLGWPVTHILDASRAAPARAAARQATLDDLDGAGEGPPARGGG